MKRPKPCLEIGSRVPLRPLGRETKRSNLFRIANRDCEFDEDKEGGGKTRQESI